MKTWSWLLLAVLIAMVGCAPGYYEPRPLYRVEAPAPVWHQNAETEQERDMRIWHQEASH